MRQLIKRRKALLNLFTFLAIILATGAVSCCSYGHKKIPQPVSSNIHSSFLFVLNKNYQKVCSGPVCHENVQAGSGSGFALATTDTYTIAVTAGHLCSPDPGTYKQETSVVVLGGATFPADIIAVSPSTDTCLLMIPGAKIKPLSVATEKVSRGERVYALSAPFGLFDSNMIAQFEGFYAGPTDNVVPKGIPGSDLLLDGYTIPSRPGSSGGPILNYKGEVVGMVIMAHPMFENFTLSPRQEDLTVVLEVAIAAARSIQ